MSGPGSESIGQLLLWATGRLGSAGIETPRLDAEVLLGAILGLERLQLMIGYNEPVTSDEAEAFRGSIERRFRREPVAYIIGEKEFWGLKFAVSPAVLVPRPETELIVEAAVKWAQGRSNPLNVLDLGTGSGCISVALWRELVSAGPVPTIVAVDISEQALAVARSNAARHGARLDLRVGSWWQALKPGERFDLIVANPPYIPPGSQHVDPELACEPAQALYAADEGLADIVTILDGLPQYMSPGGLALIEIGYGQAQRLRPRVPGASFLHDLAGIERVLRVRGQ